MKLKLWIIIAKMKLHKIMFKIVLSTRTNSIVAKTFGRQIVISDTGRDPHLPSNHPPSTIHHLLSNKRPDNQFCTAVGSLACWQQVRLHIFRLFSNIDIITRQKQSSLQASPGGDRSDKNCPINTLQELPKRQSIISNLQ